MSFTLLMQVAFNLFLLAGFAIIWMRVRRGQSDDSRVSRSLQLLQSKISILEDLSDRIDEQLTQATGLMEHKKKELDGKIAEVDRMLHEIQTSREKSLEVAQIFEDKIPHEEILERQRTRQYIKAAHLAHQGKAVADIAAQVQLPYAEVELIAKMNREQLQFNPEELPDWARVDLEVASKAASPSVSASAAGAARVAAGLVSGVRSPGDSSVDLQDSTLTLEFPSPLAAGAESSASVSFSASSHSSGVKTMGRETSGIEGVQSSLGPIVGAFTQQQAQALLADKLNLTFSKDAKVNEAFAPAQVEKVQTASLGFSSANVRQDGPKTFQSSSASSSTKFNLQPEVTSHPVAQANTDSKSAGVKPFAPPGVVTIKAFTIPKEELLTPADPIVVGAQHQEKDGLQVASQNLKLGIGASAIRGPAQEIESGQLLEERQSSFVFEEQTHEVEELASNPSAHQDFEGQGESTIEGPLASQQDANVYSSSPSSLVAAEQAAEAVRAFFEKQQAEKAEAVGESSSNRAINPPFVQSFLSDNQESEDFSGGSSSKSTTSSVMAVDQPVVAEPTTIAQTSVIESTPMIQVFEMATSNVTVADVETAASAKTRLAKSKMSAKDLQKAITTNGKPVVVQKIVFPKLGLNRELS